MNRQMGGGGVKVSSPPEADPSCRQTPTPLTSSGSHCSVGMHPTGMHSCFFFFFLTTSGVAGHDSDINQELQHQRDHKFFLRSIQAFIHVVSNIWWLIQLPDWFKASFC